MSNFAFLPSDFAEIAAAATQAEAYIHADPRTACFHSRRALEAILHWLYRHDAGLRLPYDQNLGALLHEPSLQNILPEALFQKAKVIQKVGNQAVHSNRPVRPFDALQVVRELHHLCYWLARTYTPLAPREGAAWREERIPAPPAAADGVPRAELEALEQKLAEQNEEALKKQLERDEADSMIQLLREELARVRAASEQQPDTHDYSEAETRRYIIDVNLRRAGWALDGPHDVEYPLKGMPNNKEKGFADYVLWGADGKPLAVVEAKRTTVNPEVGQQQALLYADCLEQMHGQRPIIYFTNGYTTWMWDDRHYPPRKVEGFYKREELARILLRREQRRALSVAEIRDSIVERYYQKRAIASIFEQFTAARRKALLVMATGTGKTRTAIALVDALQRMGWVKRALFLADRISLVNQAVAAFKKHLPESSPVNLVTEKETEGRVYVCTYPTMMGLIDQSHGGESRFGVGHFDLVIIDEAHRSVYQKYGAIFQYFASLLVGLTATPRDEVEKNTYDLFDLEPGVPTDAYELTEAVRDGFLVPPRVVQVDLRFPREGIEYATLSEEEKAQWESLDWGDEHQEGELPAHVNAAAINNWLFNEDTVDKVLQYLMEHGHKVAGGDRLAKTIIFARNHDHAVFIEQRFNHHYPQYAGHFARVIDHYVNYPQSLIDAFSQPEKAPHIAISVDMLDTGIDVPPVANLVFFKPVYSRIKFWQMIGRGTRLCPGLFGPEADKQDFRVFDFCFNFDFFRENPEGIEAGDSAPLGTRLFRARVQLLGHVQTHTEFDPNSAMKQSLADGLHAEVAAMNHDNFLVRMHLEAVERFQNREAWEKLSEADRETLARELAGLPTQIPTDDVESRLFDLIALRMQLALVEHDEGAFERHRKRVVEIAMLLEEKQAIPAVAKQLAYLAAIQESGFWEGINLEGLEDLRLRLRGLVPFLEKKKRRIVYTDFEDTVVSVREGEVIPIPKMTGTQYEKKVNDFLRNHLTHTVIHRLRRNEPLSTEELEELERMLVEIGEEDGETLLSAWLARSEAPSLAHFVRSLVGFDRAAAQAAFSGFLSDRSLTPPQIRFVEMIIDRLTANGVVEAEALYKSPFSDLHSGGPDALFAGNETVIDALFETLKSLEPRVQGLAG